MFVSRLWFANKLRTGEIGVWMADMGTQWKFHRGEKIRADEPPAQSWQEPPGSRKIGLIFVVTKLQNNIPPFNT